MKIKGFTLVELLAVIIILGVLSVLIVPKVINTLNESEQKTNMASAKGLLTSVEYKHQDNEMKGITENITIDYSTGQNENILDYSGNKPESGKVLITSEGKTAMAVKIGDKCYIKKFSSEDITVQDYNVGTCKSSQSFAEDSWIDIKSNLMIDRSFYEIGSEKEIEIDETSYTVRLSNTSSCPAGWTGSETACGVVIEFIDTIIDTGNNNNNGHVMNSSNTNLGGWPASSMYSYLNTTIFNKLPNVLKADGFIINTKSISGHGNQSEATNYISTGDKLYLLSVVEFLGSDTPSDSVKLASETVTDGTRQLEYYGKTGSTRTKTTPAGSLTTWWLRSASGSNSFLRVYTSGLYNSYDANYSCGVAPAFRILD